MSVYRQKETADIAVIGLAVMGQNLILNMLEKGFVVCVYNRTVSKVDDFITNEGKGLRVLGAHCLSELAIVLKKPRRIMLMVKAGQPVDAMISNILPFWIKMTLLLTVETRRCTELQQKGIRFVGCGVSGGEEGARHGPSLMPAIAAKVDNEPCCDWVGENGAGHFVKMVHNGIEYGDMQLIAEAYSLLKDAADLTHDEMAEVFAQWNEGPLNSYLVEITSYILKFKDENKQILLPNIRDAAGQKGTGKWTGIVALNYGVPLTLIVFTNDLFRAGEAVFARCLSSLKDDRVAAAKILPGPNPDKAGIVGDKNAFCEHIRKALYASKIISYAQGFMLLAEANRVFKWNLNFGAIALMWRGGCIIRSRFWKSWRIISAAGILLGIPTPAFSSALAFYDGFRCEILPANLIQAQRDYFGAHMYELMDKPGTFLHSNWTGTGGNVTSTAYSQ
ncbi:6-phosphogluconate dehydrogenase, decarboxylating [Dirofilaria immitis]|nr:6-phosphogluconate dehydrogenase, decarboxylating [Dirofilaria immitis]